MPVNTKRYTNKRLRPGTNAPAPTMAVRLKPSTVFPEGCILAEIFAAGQGTGVFAPVSKANGSVEYYAKAINPEKCATDAQGRITLGAETVAAAVGGETGETSLTMQVYYRGEFRTKDLPQGNGAGQLNAAVVADLGRMLRGPLADGLLEVNGGTIPAAPPA